VSTVPPPPPAPPPPPEPPPIAGEGLGRLVQVFHDLIRAVVGPFL
jgi:hypothetical protein